MFNALRFPADDNSIRSGQDARIATIMLFVAYLLGFDPSLPDITYSST